MKAQYESEELDLLSSIAAESNVGYTIFCWYTKIRQPLVLISMLLGVLVNAEKRSIDLFVGITV
ncbi:hypothetical protein BOO29_16675 [Vibrio navarrensis]|nr:hypothetical protein [Vibrio navarrensis]MBE4613430.1 hypothetical protein [Vibrio navarrensis]